MTYLAAAVVLLGTLCLLNLVLTIGILRRMRAQATLTGGPAGAPSALGPGAAVGTFTAVTTDGEPVSSATLTGLVGFFSSGCEPCHKLLPRFVERARELGRENVLAVLGGADEAALRALGPVARVVVAERDGGPVARAFQNTWTPMLYLIGEDHRIAAVGTRMEELPLPSRRDDGATPRAGAADVPEAAGELAGAADVPDLAGAAGVRDVPAAADVAGLAGKGRR
ncbi:TlpA disulfide reductase family protein [Sphaerisporangium sp. NPDC005288]|uniref:peroxiredoxin family protein n=1 Tax=Sphaerisporangium sp. NPDC005288 TaxID=3155114 RepID=UPI0033BF0E4E